VTGPSYAAVYALACREARAVERARDQQWRRDQARNERAAIARGELLERDAVWQREEG
jgi:hypothetical protein